MTGNQNSGRPDYTWTPYMVERLQGLRGMGWTFAAIASTINCEVGSRLSKSAAVGKWHRLKNREAARMS